VKITKIACHVGRTVNTGNFESVKVGASMEAEVEPGEDLRAVYGRLVTGCNKLIDERLTECVKAHKAAPKPTTPTPTRA
jgi:hypothetical protein